MKVNVLEDFTLVRAGGSHVFYKQGIQEIPESDFKYAYVQIRVVPIIEEVISENLTDIDEPIAEISSIEEIEEDNLEELVNEENQNVVLTTEDIIVFKGKSKTKK